MIKRICNAFDEFLETAIDDYGILGGLFATAVICAVIIIAIVVAMKVFHIDMERSMECRQGHYERQSTILR